MEKNDEEDSLVFEMIGCDVSFANALRRILIAEVPTVALETVYMWNNTSLIHDEVLSHRLGLVPLKVDHRLFDPLEPGDQPTDRNTVVFKLQVKCPSSKKGAAKKAAKDTTSSGDDDSSMDVDGQQPHDSSAGMSDLDRIARDAARNTQIAIETPHRPYTLHVYSRDLQWLPQGDQEHNFAEYGGIRPVHDDILLAKLRPGQEIDLEAHGRLGIGKDHAKFSPVATAAYRLATQVTILQPIYDELAEELVHVYEPGVFELIDAEVDGHRVKAKVVNPYACTMSRNYMRNPILKSSIEMKRIPNHFIFSVESVGMQKPAVLVANAIQILQKKCKNLEKLLEEHGNEL